MAPGFQPFAQAVEIDRPVFLAHRLEHLDRGDAVIGAALVAVILQLDLHPVRQPRLGHPRHGIIVLRLRNGQTGHAQPALPGGIFRESAPAAADFQHMIAGLRPHLIDHGLVFLGLRGLQAFLPRPEDRAGIGHRVIQPQAIEIIAQIIVMADVLLRLPAAVRLQPEPHPLVEPQQAHPRKAVIHGVVLGQLHQIHQRLQIRGRPPAVQIGIAKAQIPLADQSGKGIGIMHHHLAHRAGLGGIDAEPAPVGQHEIKPPPPHALQHLKSLGKISRQARLALDAGQNVHELPTFLLFGSTVTDTRHALKGFMQPDDRPVPRKPPLTSRHPSPPPRPA